MGLPPLGPGERKRITRTRRPHPATLLLFIVVWTASVFVFREIIVQTVLLAAIFLYFLSSERGRDSAFTFLKFSIPFILLYTGIGALLYAPNSQLIWQGPRIPLLGTLSLSWEGIVVNLVRAMRIWNLLALMVTFGGMIQPSDIIYWLRWPFAKVALTISMILTFIPSLITERNRIVEISKTRGASEHGARGRDRILALAMVYQTLLQNALERSWLLAESMYVRGYGSGKRTIYRPPRWRRFDVMMVILLVYCLFVLAENTGVLLRAVAAHHVMLVSQALCIAVLIVMLFELGGRSRVPN